MGLRAADFNGFVGQGYGKGGAFVDRARNRNRAFKQLNYSV
jgi:hypothetical protein